MSVSNLQASPELDGGPRPPGLDAELEPAERLCHQWAQRRRIRRRPDSMRCPSCQKELPPGTAKCPVHGLPPEMGPRPSPLDGLPGPTLPSAPNFQREPGVAPDLLVGRVIDERFEILSRVGSGAMGTVYRARQLNVDRDVAIKVLAPGLHTSKNLVERFRNEARIISQLRHPNTLKLHDLGELEDGRLYIVTEFLSGRTLAEVLRSERMEPRRAVRIARQICGSLAEAHQKAIIHRDLKPANIFVELIAGEEVIKVLDFGIAKLQEQPGLTVAGMIFGTPRYMSPEQARGETVDRRSDLYSLGTVLYQMLCGRAPFHAPTPAALLVSQIHDVPPPFSESAPELAASIPRPLEELVLRLLEKDPEKRPPSAEALSQLLEALELGSPTADRAFAPLGLDRSGPAVQDPTMDASAQLHAPRPRPKLLLALLLGLLALGTLGIVVWRGPRKTDPKVEAVAEPTRASDPPGPTAPKHGDETAEPSEPPSAELAAPQGKTPAPTTAPEPSPSSRAGGAPPAPKPKQSPGQEERNNRAASPGTGPVRAAPTEAKPKPPSETAKRPEPKPAKPPSGFMDVDLGELKRASRKGGK